MNFVAKSQNETTYVDITTAKNIGLNFFHHILKTPKSLEVKDLELVKKISGTTLNFKNNVIENENETFFYIFSTRPNNGFIIISANKNIVPIVGYSTENKLDVNIKNDNVNDFLENGKKKIKFLVDNKIEIDVKVKSFWEKLEKIIIFDSIKIKSNSSGNITNATSLQSYVAPLIITKWGQTPLYNLKTPPYNSNSTLNTVTGCVSTAISQVLKYWNYPNNGFNTNSYFDPNLQNGWSGTLFANFGGTKYSWNLMPNKLKSSSSIEEINATATLLSNVGIGVNMDYGFGSMGGSSSNMPNAINALKRYFGYDSTSIKYILKSNFLNNSQKWIDTLKFELSNSRPIIYAGSGISSGGHCFVLDGYRDVTINNNNLTYFSINWGWDGEYDGEFFLDNLTPTTYFFNDDQGAIIGIKPPANQIQYLLSSYKTPSIINSQNNSIEYLRQFSLNANVINKGSVNFNGDIGIFIIDSANQLIDSIVLENRSLPVNNYYVDNLIFSSSTKISELVKYVPGKYYALLAYKPTNQGWQTVQNYNNNQNFSTFYITNSKEIEMYSQIKVNNIDSISKDSYISGNFSVLNKGNSTFLGKYNLGLFNLDGSLAQSLFSYSDTITGLPKNYYYTFQYNNLVNVNTGIYYLFATYTPKDSTGKYVIGSSNYANPIKININRPLLLADNYEKNNKIDSAFTINNNFINDSLNFSTNGANIHNKNDIDYFKVILNENYLYNINLNVQDINNTDTLSLNSILYYANSKSSKWSSGYSNYIPNLTLYGPDTLYIYVGPYFLGNFGTYKLNLIIKRSCNISKPIISSSNNNRNLCEGNNLQLASNVQNGNQWYLNGNIINGGINKDYLATKEGTYTLIQTINTCKSPFSDEFKLNLISSPSSPTIQRDNQNNLVSSSKFNNKWYKDGVLVSDTNQAYKPSINGSYAVKSSLNGCFSQLSSPYYFLITDIIKISSQEYIKFNPNPFNSFLNIYFKINGYDKINVDLIDITSGKKQAEFTRVYDGQNLNTSNLSSGIYLIRLYTHDLKHFYQVKCIKM